MHTYIEQIPGVQGKLTDHQIAEIIDQAHSDITIQSDSYQPHTQLLSAQQTSKMFELMNNKQVDPSDLHSGYQSLSAYNQENQFVVKVPG